MSFVKPPLIVILGPTAVGKTQIAIQIAERLDGEIVSVDSRLFYRGMDIGTAKPTPVEQKCVPHHLIDVADPDDTWSLAVFQQAAEQAITEIHRRGRMPILVGGTGQYIDAVVHGWTPPRAAPNPHLRTILDDLAQHNGGLWLHTRLEKLDPVAAASIDARNIRRTIRALEVIFITGLRFSDQRKKIGTPYNLLRIGLIRPRPELYTLIDMRIDAMFESGLLEETRHLLEAGWQPSLPSMSAIGYRESIQVLQGLIEITEAKKRMRKATRIFVRRQGNWFKETDQSIHWFRVEPGCISLIETLIHDHYLGQRIKLE